MPETAATMHPETRKRRSTRIEQAVPLVVSGVDALGRPFQEHTSTLIINCHGTRYQSKHYVLKNMWVTLEVPHPESGHNPRAVRGKVTWIQRPHSVRQLFQIALELENPGNVWGIAFPPEDWFPFADNQIPQRLGESAADMPTEAERQSHQRGEGSGGDAVHIMPVSEGADVLQAVNQQVTHLLAGAQQQIQSAAQKAAAEAVAAEAKLLLNNLQLKVEEAGSAVQTAASQATERATAQATAQLQEHQEALSRSLQEDFPRIIAPQVEKAVQQAVQEIAHSGAAHFTALEKRMQTALRGAEETAQQFSSEASADAQRLHILLDRFHEGVGVRADEFAARVDSISREAVEKTQTHLDALVHREEEKLGQHAEAVLADAGKRIEPLLETTGQESLARIASQLEARLDPHLHRAEGLIEKLSAAQEIPEETLRAVQYRVQRIADQSIEEATVRLRGSLTATEREFHDTAKATRTAWLAEFEARADEIRNCAADSLGKTAEWYEKKTQVQMQTAFEKGIEQAGQNMREKAGEMSGIFAAELNHYSRSYVGHAQNQMDEAVKEGFEHARNLFGEAADTTAAAFHDEIQRSAQGELDNFQQSLEKTREDAGALMEAGAEQVRAKARMETDSCLGDFQYRLAAAIAQGVAGAGQQLETQLAPVMDTWRAAAENHQKQLQENYTRLSDASVEGYKTRLENVSNSWMLATVTTLDQHSQNFIASVAQSAEDRLREACSKAFAGIAESLRERLMDMASGLSPRPAASEDK